MVEDDEILSDVISRNLHMRQHHVDVAHDGLVALNLLGAKTFDLIIFDLDFPGQAGWDLLRTVLQEPYLHTNVVLKQRWAFPVVVLSVMRVSIQLLTELQLLAYVPKPFAMEALLHFAAQATTRSPDTVR
ncbi:hypothetical protein KSX_69560 [Ktedonospora formicarum]|uniref:Response regulatory domain-containing protein n=1 Tax=Ktedonospora formicarum TaxID=2778364 RepID=A0A8J3MWL8_9CHLR|nr:hypothetical protein KSX_69560 [Ktedonospora formicarum]